MYHNLNIIKYSNLYIVMRLTNKNFILLRGIFVSAMISVLFAGSAHAQRSLKYDNVIKEAESLESAEAYQLYQDYLSIEPAMKSNVYFRLAELSSQIMKTLDPVVDYVKMLKFSENSRHYYGLCRAGMDDNELRRTGNLFTGVQSSEKRLSVKDVEMYIRMKLDRDSVYLSEASALHGLYVAIVDNYMSCAELYAEISKNNASQADIYAGWQDNELLVRTLMQKFESLHADLTAYREALAISPVEGRAAKYEYRTIENYRIDGFTPVNFATGTSALWDYGVWAAGVVKYYNENIEPEINRSKMAEARLNEQIRELKSVGRQLETLDVPDDNLFRMNIPGASSEIPRKSTMLRFMNMLYDSINMPFAATTGMNTIKSDYYYRLSKLYQEYGRLSNLDDAGFNEMTDMYLGALNNYRLYTINSANRFRKTANLKFKKQDIPMYFGIGFYRASFSGYVTKAIIADGTGGCYLSGSSINPQGFAVAFVARSRDMQNIDWMKNADISKMMYDDCAIALSPVSSGGCYALVTSKNVSDAELTTQTIIQYDDKGAEKLQITLPEKHLPLGRAIHYNAITNNILIAFYGNSENRFQNDGLLDIRQISADNEQKFKYSMNLNGDIIAILSTSAGGVMVFGNYIDMKTPLGEYRTGHDGVGIFSLLLSSTGALDKVNIYPSKNSRYGIRATGTAEGTFTISGQSGDARKNSASPYSADGDPVYIITDSEGKLLIDSETIYR